MERGHFKNKRRYDTPGQTQWCSLRGPRLIPPKSDLNLLQLFSTYFLPREGKKKQENLLLSNKFKLSEINWKEYTRRREKKNGNWTVVYAIGRPFCLAVLHTVYAHTVSLRGLTLVPGHAWIPRQARRGGQLHCSTSSICQAACGSEKEPASAKRETERGRPSRFIEFSNFLAPVPSHTPANW